MFSMPLSESQVRFWRGCCTPNITRVTVDELDRAYPCVGWSDLYHCRIGPDHLWLHRFCSGWVVYRGRVRFNRLVAGGILLFHATR